MTSDIEEEKYASLLVYSNPQLEKLISSSVAEFKVLKEKKAYVQKKLNYLNAMKKLGKTTDIYNLEMVVSILVLEEKKMMMMIELV